jgi:hypothetical protein
MMWSFYQTKIKYSLFVGWLWYIGESCLLSKDNNSWVKIINMKENVSRKKPTMEVRHDTQNKILVMTSHDKD